MAEGRLVVNGEDLNPIVLAARGHMVHCVGIFDAKRAGHGASVAEERTNVKIQDVTLKGLWFSFL